MADALVFIMNAAIGSPAEAEEISKIELHDHQPADKFRFILCCEKDAYRRNITISLNNGQKFACNVGGGYGNSHEKCLYDSMMVDCTGATGGDIYYNKQKLVMTCLKTKSLSSETIEALKTKTFIFYWNDSGSGYFGKSENCPSPAQLGL